jgi:ADP-heptose:LPS heptosyltransferase
MPCSPCKKKNCRQRQCLTHITVDEVFEAVSVLYKRSATN